MEEIEKIGEIDDLDVIIYWKYKYVEFDNNKLHDFYRGLDITFKELDNYIEILQKARDIIRERFM